MKVLFTALLCTISMFTLTAQKNADFEMGKKTGEVKGGGVPGWVLGTWGEGEGNYELVDGAGVDGSRALKINVTQVPAEKKNPHMVYIQNWKKSEFEALEGQTVKFSFYAKADKLGNRMKVDIRDTDREFQFADKVFKLSEEFELFTLTTTVDATDIYGLHLGFASVIGSYWVDNFTYEVVEAAEEE